MMTKQWFPIHVACLQAFATTQSSDHQRRRPRREPLIQGSYRWDGCAARVKSKIPNVWPIRIKYYCSSYRWWYQDGICSVSMWTNICQPSTSRLLFHSSRHMRGWKHIKQNQAEVTEFNRLKLFWIISTNFQKAKKTEHTVQTGECMQIYCEQCRGTLTLLLLGVFEVLDELLWWVLDLLPGDVNFEVLLFVLVFCRFAGVFMVKVMLVPVPWSWASLLLRLLAAFLIDENEVGPWDRFVGTCKRHQTNFSGIKAITCKIPMMIVEH